MLREGERGWRCVEGGGGGRCVEGGGGEGGGVLREGRTEQGDAKDGTK